MRFFRTERCTEGGGEGGRQGAGGWEGGRERERGRREITGGREVRREEGIIEEGDSRGGKLRTPLYPSIWGMGGPRDVGANMR